MEPALDTCRLCGGPALFQFRKTVLQKYEISYFECQVCGSLQTEPPYWLDEAYARDSDLDVGKAQRNVLTASLCAYVLGRVSIGSNQPCLDFAGGEGLFCRLMRDRGLSFFHSDKYVASIYAAPYRVSDLEALSPVAVTAFEALEHLSHPIDDLKQMFGLKPRVLLCTTDLYTGQGEDWFYLATPNGRHVFFYSRQAMEWIAARYGYRYVPLAFLHAFVRNDDWDSPEWTALRGIPHEQLVKDAVQSYAEHLTGDAWKHIVADYFTLRKGRFGF